MADGELGFGSKFQTGDGSSPETFTDLALVSSITPPGMSRDSIDVSHMQSPDAWRDFIAGLKDAGEVTLELNFKPGSAGFLALMTEMSLSSDNATKSRRIVFPDTSRFDFEAFLTNIEPEAPHDDKMVVTATFKVTGAPTLTQAS